MSFDGFMVSPVALAERGMSISSPS